MRCPHCLEDHPEGVKFCTKTGAPIIIHPNQPNSNEFNWTKTQQYNYSENIKTTKANPIISIVSGLIGITLLILAFFVYEGRIELDPSEIQSEIVFWQTKTTSNESLINQIPTYKDRESATPTPTSNLENSLIKTAQTVIPIKTEVVSNTEIDLSNTPINKTPTPILSPTSRITPIMSPQVSISEWIVYTYGEDEKREIFLFQPGSGEKKQLTSNIYNDEAPTLRMSTQQLVYSSYRIDGWELYLLDLTTMKETQLTKFSGQARHPEWSPNPDSHEIIFEGRSNSTSGMVSNIWLLDAITGKITQLTRGNSDSRPQWAPDGKKIVFGRALLDNTGDGRVTSADFLTIIVFDLETSTLSQITHNQAVDNFQYSWSPDGEWILFCSVKGDVNGDGFMNLDDSRNLWLIRPDGSGEHEIDIGNKVTFSPSWSPSGQEIVFTSHRSSGDEIWIYNLNSENLKKIVPAGSNYHTEWVLQ